MSALLLAGALMLSGCGGGGSPAASAASGSSASSSVTDSYGALPTFLPTLAAQPDAELTGSVGHPAVTSEGDTVLANVGAGTVRAQVTGPVVPGEGLPKVTEATTCTWTVTFAAATTAVPIRLRDFVTVDEKGHAYRLQFVPGAKRPPATLRPGQRTSFELRVVMSTGEGVMRWQPNGHALAVWDFVVEND